MPHSHYYVSYLKVNMVFRLRFLICDDKLLQIKDLKSSSKLNKIKRVGDN